MNNRIYLVGGDHHNGLGLARIFGKNNFKVSCLVIAEVKASFLSYSKYVDELIIFQTEKKAFDYLSSLPGSLDKAFIIPYSDGAAYELDTRLNEFNIKFYVPSINNEKNAIAYMMEKQNQYNFALKEDIPVAYTVVVNLKENISYQLKEMVYPCIIKPVISAEGDKRDIAICKTYEALLNKLEEYREKGYKRALVQEYLKIDYEIDVFGCITKSEPYIFQIPTKTIRSWPVAGGTNSFSKIIIDEKIVKKCKTILEKLKIQGFWGLYDVELFVVNGDVYLNEINYRNSGDVYMGVKQGYFYPIAWVMDCLNLPYKLLENPLIDSYTMTECADIRNVLIGEIKLLGWLKDVRKCADFALWSSDDMKPVIYRYWYYIKQFFKRRGCR